MLVTLEVSRKRTVKAKNRPSADIDAPQIEEARRIQSLELPVPLGRVRRSVLRTIASALEIAPIMASAG